jgi:flagellar biogenesis protein FliO
MRIYLNICLVAWLLVPALCPAEEISHPEASESFSAIEQARQDMRTRAALTARDQENAKTQVAEDEPNPFMNMIQGLALCLGLFAFVVFVIKKTHRVSRGSQQARMILHERLALTTKSSLHLVEVDGRCFLIGCGAEHVTIAPQQGLHAGGMKPLQQSAPCANEQATIYLREAI